MSMSKYIEMPYADFGSGVQCHICKEVFTTSFEDSHTFNNYEDAIDCYVICPTCAVKGHLINEPTHYGSLLKFKNGKYYFENGDVFEEDEADIIFVQFIKFQPGQIKQIRIDNKKKAR